MTVSLSTALFNLTGDQLKEYASLLISGKKPTTRADLVKLIEQQLAANLKDFWNQLDEIDRLRFPKRKEMKETVLSRNRMFSRSSHDIYGIY